MKLNASVIVSTLFAAALSLIPMESSASTQTFYTYINSNNGATFGGNNVALAGIRGFAMSQHASNGHNYWTCTYGVTTNIINARCSRSPTPTSGASAVYGVCPAGGVSYCDVYVAYGPIDLNHVSFDRMQSDFLVRMTWLSSQADTYFNFPDGSFGQTGIGQSVYWITF